MQAPSIPVAGYLKLLSDCNVTQSKEYLLVNQEVKDGKVYFRTDQTIQAFRRLLEASESGRMPLSELSKKHKSIKEWAAISSLVNFADIQATIKNLNGPDGQGWYRGQCPVCAANEVGEAGHTKNSLVYNPTIRVIYCHKGCNYTKIISYITPKFEDGDDVSLAIELAQKEGKI